MFRVIDNVPEVYGNDSRDFQLISRLYDLCNQTTRYSIDSLLDVTSTQQCNERLLPLLGEKLGYFKSTNIDQNALRLILSAFPFIIRHKGSQRGIDCILNVFTRIAHNNSLTIEYDTDKHNHVISFIASASVPYRNVLYDLLDYVRPAGFSLTFVTSIETEMNIDSVSIISKPLGVDSVSYTNVTNITSFTHPPFKYPETQDTIEEIQIGAEIVPRDREKIQEPKVGLGGKKISESTQINLAEEELEN